MNNTVLCSLYELTYSYSPKTDCSNEYSIQKLLEISLFNDSNIPKMPIYSVVYLNLPWMGMLKTHTCIS